MIFFLTSESYLIQLFKYELRVVKLPGKIVILLQKSGSFFLFHVLLKKNGSFFLFFLVLSFLSTDFFVTFHVFFSPRFLEPLKNRAEMK